MTGGGEITFWVDSKDLGYILQQAKQEFLLFHSR
jgi:hypothetical protein